jgi:uncharacterized protein YwgA
MAQKVIYLLTKGTELRRAWGLNYRLHYYGPYSPEVTKASENLITFRLVREYPLETENLTRYDLEITKEGEERAERLLNELDNSSKRRLGEMIGEADELNQTNLQQVIKRAYEQATKEGLIRRSTWLDESDTSYELNRI